VDEDRKPDETGAGDSLSESSAASSRLPRKLRRRLDHNAEAWLRACAGAEPDLPPVIEKIVVDRHAQRRGWYAAAACLALAIAGWWPRLVEFSVDAAHGISPLQTAAERGREHLLKLDSEHLGRWAWSHETGVAANVRGEVVWDPVHQVGYLTLQGLEPNAESGRQYQLWIFDGERDDRYPVDGGVFDVPHTPSMITVPIRPALQVRQAVAFAVTLEPAGGVVVSDRQRLMALARAQPLPGHAAR
jgi:hypothetical protein